MSIKKEPQRLLVLFPGSLGDAICVWPAIQHLRRERRQEIVLAVRGEAFELYAAAPFAGTVISLERRIFSELFLLPPMSRESRAFFSLFSEIVSWYGHTQVQVVDHLRSLTSGRVQSFTFFRGQESIHAVAYYLRCVGVEELRAPALEIPEATVRWRDEYWRQRGWNTTQKLLLLHPGSGGKHKRWSAEGFRDVANWWTHEQQGTALILLGPAETPELCEWQTAGEVVTGLSVWQVAALLQRVERYLGNDSGISHLAGSVGTEGVVLFGPTQPQQWRPLGGRLSVLQNVAYREVHPEAQGISLEEIAVDAVTRKLLAD
jgi:ADP-heptose:LPS heptosyltransferase